MGAPHGLKGPRGRRGRPAISGFRDGPLIAFKYATTILESSGIGNSAPSPLSRALGPRMLDLSRQEWYRAQYRARRPGWRPAGEVFNALLEPLLAPSVRALDAGCGRFGVLGRFRDRVKLAVGVDGDFPSLQENRILPLRVHGRLEALPFPSNAFDLVLCTWVIEHLPEPERAFREIGAFPYDCGLA